ncbi:hypothetical protein BLA17378_05268 [Burkholderia aenigmatica]|uniref:DUF551 domain-containing protein n=1 Tax=Burkholderia aenigmatica TaxID=2015348 RepID=A0ABY6Y2I6_9BURK|nr:DUF551 domain-containing protein [Burkholderia aenigmatica]VWD01485.1 hypothetical protein BLA17378_05268 [Burkholderia aenigmatica]
MTDDNKTDCKLTAQARATIMDACQSISRNADELKNCHTVDGDWGDDLEAKAFYEAELRLLGRLTALLAAQQPEPQCTCDMRTKVLGDGCAICQPEPRAEVTDGWVSVDEKLPSCKRKHGTLGVEVLIWPAMESGERTAFFGRRISQKPTFYRYGAPVHGVTHWMPLPAEPPRAQELGSR